VQGISEILGESFTEDQANAFKDLLNNMPSQEDLPNALRSILGDNTNFTESQIKALENYVDSLYDVSDALDEFYEQITEKINAALDDMNEKAGRAISRNE
jgi:hypothetical protein